MPAEIVRTLSIPLADLIKMAREGHLYAILDACDAPEIFDKVRELEADRVVCLYRGRLDPKVLADAPYLVFLEPSIVEWLAKRNWLEPWGIFAVSTADLRTLRKHFRKFLQVEGPEGEALFFRFYDPRVLQTFLPACDRQELQEFFGPLAAYGIAATDPGEAILYLQS